VRPLLKSGQRTHLTSTEINIANRNWSYPQFQAIGHPEFLWSMGVLKQFAMPGDPLNPEHVMASA
jgi:hypothetical protein